MDDKTQKERLEQELRFLKESFEAEVISKEEFEKGKERIEKKLKEIEKRDKEKQKTVAEEQNQEQIPEKKVEEKKEEKPEPKTDESIEKKEEEKIKLKVIQETEEQYFEPVQIKVEEKKVEQVPEKQEVVEEKKEDSKVFKYGIVFVVLLLIAFFLYSLLKSPEEEKSQIKFVAACSSNEDCKQEGKEGICIAPGTKNAKCEFIEIPKINVIILNDRKNCFNCDTQRVLGILESWFEAIDAKETGYNTNEGKAIAEKFNPNLLPFYVLDEDIIKKPSFEQFKRVFTKKDKNYVLSEDVAASTFYFKRDDIPNKLDLFVISGDSASIKAENNLKEFLDAFNEVKFEKHLSTDKLTQELNIKTFPTFLINNRVKFSGVHTAETVKGNFCKLNQLKECEKSLSKSLV